VAETLSEIYKKGFQFAKKHYPEDAEDFAQELCIYAWQKDISDFGNLYVARRLYDYLRKHYGDSRGNRCKYGKTKPIIDGKLADDRPIGGHDNELPECLYVLTKYERLIFVMVKKFEISHAAIADCCGVSEITISQLIVKINKKVQDLIDGNLTPLQRIRLRSFRRVLMKGSK